MTGKRRTAAAFSAALLGMMAATAIAAPAAATAIAAPAAATAADAGSGGADEPRGRRVFTDARHPPAYERLDTAEQTRVDLGHAVFNTQWVAAGTDNAARRDGLGPLFNAAACDACHNEGAHGRGPTGDGEAPAALVIQLELPPPDSKLPPGGAAYSSSGDPRYGHTLSTAALDGFQPEGKVSIRYAALSGRYPDGRLWQLRAPRYVLTELTRGPLSPRTVVQPRLAPALFGVGLLEAVEGETAARFGWQGTSIAVRDQTTKAFARDMGLTTSDRPVDDCTAAEPECRAAPDGGIPEVADDLLEAVVEFQRTLAVPESVLPGDRETAESGARPEPDGRAKRAAPAGGLFAAAGCAACHRPTLPLRQGTIAPYTDLHLHDLGSPLADRDARGHSVPSRWRTAPLWGMAYRLRHEPVPTFLHDGRARSIEEAILWHDGEAQAAKLLFTRLTAAQRTELIDWITSL